MTEYLIRKCERGDINSIINLCEQHAAYEEAIYSRQGKEKKLISLMLDATPGINCWVVEIENSVVGYATYTFDYSTWDAAKFLYLDCLYLDEHYRGLGIGEDIMKRLFKVAKQNNCVNVQWQTPAFNKRAIKFYNRVGAKGKNKVRFTVTT